jgi:hypothetical protein
MSQIIKPSDSNSSGIIYQPKKIDPLNNSAPANVIVRPAVPKPTVMPSQHINQMNIIKSSNLAPIVYAGSSFNKLVTPQKPEIKISNSRYIDHP